MKMGLLRLFFLLSGLTSPSWADTRAVMEGVPASVNTILVSTRNSRVLLDTTTYSGGVPNVGLYTTSNVVVSNGGNNCVFYATGSIACIGTINGSSIGTPWTRSGTNVSLTNLGDNVGIGISNPVTTLHVGAVSQATTLTSLILAEAAGTVSIGVRDTLNLVEAVMGSGGGVGSVGTATNNNFILRTNNTNRMTLDTAGNAGIGTTSPFATLHAISGGTAVQDPGGVKAIMAEGLNFALSNPGNLVVYSNDAQAADIGGSIGLGGKYNTPGNSVTVAAIAGRKTNSTSGNLSGYLALSSRLDPGNVAEGWRLDAARHVELTGTAPTVGTCGTTPSVVGNDNIGIITFGTGVTTACTLTFANAWTNTPACTISITNSAIGTSISPASTTAITINTSANYGGGLVYYICRGYR